MSTGRVDPVSIRWLQRPSIERRKPFQGRALQVGQQSAPIVGLESIRGVTVVAGGQLLQGLEQPLLLCRGHTRYRGHVFRHTSTSSTFHTSLQSAIVSRTIQSYEIHLLPSSACDSIARDL